MPFARPELASEIANRLIHPGALDEIYRSGLFLSAPRRTGKSTFLKNDFVPVLEEDGALPIYVDLWSNPAADPADLIRNAVQRALRELETPGSRILAALRRVNKIDVGVASLKFGFGLDSVATPTGTTLADVFCEVVDRVGTHVVMIVDEVQHALTTENGANMLTAMKAARDAVNLRSETAGYFYFVGTGSHRGLVSDLTTRRRQPFAGAMTRVFPPLGLAYVESVLDGTRAKLGARCPSPAVALRAFVKVGNRPEELLKALNILEAAEAVGDHADEHLLTIAETLRTTAANDELIRLANLGPFAEAIFTRLVRIGTGASLFTAEAAREYGQALGIEVAVSEVQPVVNQMLGQNLVMRHGHGDYAVSDEFVAHVWAERLGLAGSRVDAPPAVPEA